MMQVHEESWRAKDGNPGQKNVGFLAQEGGGSDLDSKVNGRSA